MGCQIFEDLAHSLNVDYGAFIWQSLGFDTVQILNFQCGFQLVAAAASALSMTFVDRIKRPNLIASGLLACAVTVAIFTGLQSRYLDTMDRSGLIACSVMLYVFAAVFSLVCEAAVYFYVAEIWPTHLRPHGMAIGMSALAMSDLLFLQVAPTAFATIAWRFYILFAIIPAVGAVIVFFYFPDTLHKPLEEISAMFGDGDKVAVFQSDLENKQIRLEEIEHSTSAPVHREPGGNA